MRRIGPQGFVFVRAERRRAFVVHQQGFDVGKGRGQAIGGGGGSVRGVGVVEDDRLDALAARLRDEADVLDQGEKAVIGAAPQVDDLGDAIVRRAVGRSS